MFKKIFLVIIVIFMLLSVMSGHKYPDRIKLTGNYYRLQDEVSLQLKDILFPALEKHGINGEAYKIRLYSYNENSDIEGYQIDGFVMIRGCRGQFTLYGYEGDRQLAEYKEINSCKVHTESTVRDENNRKKMFSAGIIQKGKYEYEMQTSFVLAESDWDKADAISEAVEEMYQKIFEEIAYTDRG